MEPSQKNEDEKHWEICAENLFIQKRLNSTSFLASVRTDVRDKVQEVIHGTTTMVKTGWLQYDKMLRLGTLVC